MNDEKKRLLLLRNLAVFECRYKLSKYCYIDEIQRAACNQVILEVMSDFIKNIESNITSEQVSTMVESAIIRCSTKSIPTGAQKYVTYKNGTKSYFKRINGIWFYSVEDAWIDGSAEDNGFKFMLGFVIHPTAGVRKLKDI